MTRTHDVRGNTEIFAVIGDPVSHSLSPIMHNAAYKSLNINAVYIACHVLPNELLNAVNAIRALKIKGLNVTIPHKQPIAHLVDEIFGDSIHTGSVNTIIHRNGHLSGTSTDGIGFIRSLREDGGFDPNGKKVILFGAGGTAVAFSYRLIQSGVSTILCINRGLPNAEKLRMTLRKSTGYEIDLKPLSQLSEIDLSQFDLLINTTSVGLSDDTAIIPQNLLNSGLFVFDVIYKKHGTRLVNEAREIGCSVLDGLSLLVYQGAESFRLWFDREPPINVMRDSLHNYLDTTI